MNDYLPTEKQKMLSGQLYNARDKELSEDRLRARLMLKALNQSGEDEAERKSIINELFPHVGKDFWLQPPFYCDYGYNIIIGDGVFFNFSCVVLDVMKVTIGSKTLFGPNVQIYTATHPMNHRERTVGLEYAKPVTIGEDVWVGEKGDSTMSVKHKRLGKHGVLVSNICLGTMNFGWHTSEEDSFKIMDRALELGINFFDTADVYGWSVEHGYTEEIIGRWLAQGGGRRDAVVLATKVYNPVDRKANLPEVNSDGRSLSAYKIRKHCEGSLKRLQTDWIDLYQMHHIDRDCPWDETWQSFDTLIKQGKSSVCGFK
jgi:hypothetical protein